MRHGYRSPAAVAAHHDSPSSGSRRVHGTSQVGVELVDLVGGEHVGEEQEAGLGQEVPGLLGPVAEAEPLIEVEG